jgi:YHS domain-containing protein
MAHENDTHGHNHDQAAGSAICPVCRMSVDPASSPNAEFQGRTFYFCNEKCERAFLRNAAKYSERAIQA